MKWHFAANGDKPEHLKEYLSISGDERYVMPTYYNECKDVMVSYDDCQEWLIGEHYDEIGVLYNNYVKAWVDINDVLADYMANKEMRDDV